MEREYTGAEMTICSSSGIETRRLREETPLPDVFQGVYFGNVASILEVGTGFHPDLSGRENIFLSGTLMGMSNKEIRESYKEIVQFSEIGDFIEAKSLGFQEFLQKPIGRSRLLLVVEDVLLAQEQAS